MFDWLWKGVAAVAGLAAMVFGVNAARTKQRMERMERERVERDTAMQRMAEQAYRDLIETRKRHAGQAPVNPAKRTDFE